MRDWSSDVCSSDLVDGAKTKKGKKEPVKDECFQHLMRAIRSKRNIVSPTEFSTGTIETLSTSPYFESRENGRASCRERV